MGARGLLVMIYIHVCRYAKFIKYKSCRSKIGSDGFEKNIRENYITYVHLTIPSYESIFTQWLAPTQNALESHFSFMPMPMPNAQKSHHKPIHANHKPCLINWPVTVEVAVDVLDTSLQPNQPGVVQLVELDVNEDDCEGLADELIIELTAELVVELIGSALLVAGVSEGVVTIGAGAALGDVIVVVRVMVVGSLQPNHPGVLHVEVVIVLVMVVVGV
jgi:hypothetical protein